MNPEDYKNIIDQINQWPIIASRMIMSQEVYDDIFNKKYNYICF